MTHRLILHNLSQQYANGVQAMQGVSLQLPNGMFGLLGPNGAGKSTLMRTIATLQTPDSGSLYFDGTDVLASPHYMKERIGYLPQQFGVYPKVSAYRLLNHIALLKGVLSPAERKEQVNALLELTNLFEHRQKSVHTFSGGMKQRFGIAQALLGNPQLIMVDEPTAGLDPEERYRFYNLLSEIGTEKVVVLSTHIVADVKELCPQMAIMAQGKIIVQGAPANVVERLCGMVWVKSVSPEQVPELEKNFTVLSKRFVGGKPILCVLSETAPENGFTPLSPDLEHAYFATLSGHYPKKEVPSC